MLLQSQNVIGLYLDANPTKKRCGHNIGCPLGPGIFEILEYLEFRTIIACRRILITPSYLQKFTNIQNSDAFKTRHISRTP